MVLVERTVERAALRPDRAPAFLAPVERTVRTTGDGARPVRDAGTAPPPPSAHTATVHASSWSGSSFFFCR